VTLTKGIVQLNQAIAGFNSGFGPESTSAAGGGIYQAEGSVTLDGFTFAHLLINTDSNNDAFNNLFGHPIFESSGDGSPSNVVQAATVADLINALHAANDGSGSNDHLPTPPNTVL